MGAWDERGDGLAWAFSCIFSCDATCVLIVNRIERNAASKLLTHKPLPGRQRTFAAEEGTLIGGLMTQVAFMFDSLRLWVRVGFEGPDRSGSFAHRLDNDPLDALGRYLSQQSERLVIDV